MHGAIFWDTLRHSWRQTLYWGLFAALFACLIVLMVPVMDSMKIIDVVKNMPPVLLRMAGMGNDVDFLATPEGFIALGFFSKFALFFTIYPAVLGLRVTNTEETSGTLDILLSLPVQRQRVIVEKTLAYSLMLVMMTMLVLIGVFMGTLLVTIELDAMRLAALVVNLLPVTIFVMALSLCVGAISGKRQFAPTVVAVIIVGSFMLQSFSGMVEGTWVELPVRFSFFTYYDAAGVVQHGLNALHVAGFLGLSALLVMAALWIFERRDVGV